MPTTLLLPMYSTGPFGQGYVGYVQQIEPSDDRHTTIWKSPVVRDTGTEAKADADEAVERIHYERRHQLQLI